MRKPAGHWTGSHKVSPAPGDRFGGTSDFRAPLRKVEAYKTFVGAHEIVTRNKYLDLWL
jgi:hypothetical protein